MAPRSANVTCTQCGKPFPLEPDQCDCGCQGFSVGPSPSSPTTEQAVIRLMVASSCFGHEVCPSPPCACARSLIDAISPATPAPGDVGEIVRDLRYRRVMCDGGNGNVYDIADETCEQAADALERISAEMAVAVRQRDDALAKLNTPETEDWMAGVPLEAAHQIERRGADHDAGKQPLDWFWLIGYLGQKAATSAMAGDIVKAKHHTISTAAALLNWHRQLAGISNVMRPGIDPVARGLETHPELANANIIERNETISRISAETERLASNYWRLSQESRAAEARLAEAEKVIDAAAMMANVCFNAKDSDKVPENVRTWLANTQEAFDKARDAFRRAVE